MLTILVFYGIAGIFYIDLTSTWSKFFSQLSHPKDLIRAQKEYAILQLYNMFTQCAIRLAILFLIGCIFCVSIVTNIVIVGMHSRLNWINYFGIMVTGIFVDIGTFALMNLAGSSYNHSNEFIKCFRKYLRQRQYFHKLGISIQPLRFNVGLFFICDRNFLLVYWNSLIDWTIYCVLL